MEHNMNEKPREKFLRIGEPRKMTTEELFSILLGHGSISTNVYDLSANLAEFLRNNSGRTVTVADLKQFDGIGDVKAMQILSALELGRRYLIKSSKTALSEMDWDFADLKQADRQYGVHFFHHYTAKFIPQIPSRIIRQFARKGNVVLDPFMGSGTTLVEAMLYGCNSFGLDTNPIAIKIAKAKTLCLNDSRIREMDDFIRWLSDAQKNPRFTTEHAPIELYPGSQDWFRTDVSYKIYSILEAIQNYSPEVKNFLEVGLSNLLKGMSNARMDSVTPVLPGEPMYVDRKHYYREVNNLTRDIPVFRRLLSHIRRMCAAIKEFNQSTDNALSCEPIMGDARKLSSYINHCELVVTSPPYWSAQNYENIHKLSMGLFNLETEFGKEIGQNHNSYLDDMNLVIGEIKKILKGYFAIVIGHDENKKTHEKLFQLIVENGFDPVESITRNISNQVSRAKQIKVEYIYIFKS
ncbi:MAG: DNA methyltransferase [Anaerolineaceae bacterium]